MLDRIPHQHYDAYLMRRPSNLIEHNYARQGALNLFSAFGMHTGQVYGQCYHRKRQKEFIAFLTHLDEQIPPAATKVHIVCDNVSTHHGKQVHGKVRGMSIPMTPACWLFTATCRTPARCLRRC